MEPENIIAFLAICLAIVFVTMMGTVLYDTMQLQPEAAEKANIHCQNRGYDFYESFSRKLLSTKPIGIKCKYVDNYKEMDIDIRQYKEVK